MLDTSAEPPAAKFVCDVLNFLEATKPAAADFLTTCLAALGNCLARTVVTLDESILLAATFHLAKTRNNSMGAAKQTCLEKQH